MCLYSAPDAESVREAQREARMPVEGVWACQHYTPAFQFEIYPEKDIPLPKEKKPQEKSPRIALIVDDIGYDRAVVKKFLSLNLPITLSILPKSPFTKSIIDAAQKKHVEIMLHQPMEPFEYPQINPGPGTLLTSMTPDEKMLVKPRL